MADKTFRTVEPLFRFKDDESKIIVASIENNEVRLHGLFTLKPSAAIALQDWLASATGYYPKEPAP